MGTHWVRESPPPPPGPPPAPLPPFPPFAPFSECQDTCSPGAIPDHRKHQCRDGGYGAYYPTLCFFSSSCITCGPRTDQSDYVHQDNNCDHARNGVCEDGGTGSSYYIDIEGGQAHLCGYGTDLADCAVYGPRKILSFGYLSYAGVTNMSYPLPPPPPPFPPPTPSPPLDISWRGCVTDPARVCYSFSKKRVGYADFACSGTAEQLYWKVRRGICTAPLALAAAAAFDVNGPAYEQLTHEAVRDYFLNDGTLEQYCSDGGFGSVAVRVGSVGFKHADATFGCDYGSQECLRTLPRARV